MKLVRFNNYDYYVLECEKSDANERARVLYEALNEIIGPHPLNREILEGDMDSYEDWSIPIPISNAAIAALERYERETTND